MSSLIELKCELDVLNRKWKKYHSDLVLAEAKKNEIEVKKLLRKIHTVAQKQSKIKETLNGTNQNL